MKEIHLLAATGNLGTGFAEESLVSAVERGADMIGCDSGSTDYGPYYLGSGRSQPSRASYKRDLRIMLKSGVSKGIPILIGSAGTSGGDPHVRFIVDIVEEIAREEMLHFPMATVRCELDKAYLKRKLREGRIRPLKPAPHFDEEVIDRAVRFVGMMGAEPFMAAMERGAQVVIAGRSSDTSIFAALPMMRGFPKGPTWHAAKILECGAASVEHRLYPDCMLCTVREDGFVAEPPNPLMRCTPVSIVAHTLYENDDPYHMYEPCGMLDTSQCRYEPHGERGVLVTGSTFVEAEHYTVRLEGVERLGHRLVMLAGVRDPVLLRQIDSFLEGVRERTLKKVSNALRKNTPEDFWLKFRVYGKNGAMGELEPKKRIEGHEVCVVFEAIAPTYEDCRAVLTMAWYTALHHPVPEWEGQVTNLAFPFSAPEMDAGEAFRFCVNHLLELDDPLEPFSIELREV